MTDPAVLDTPLDPTVAIRHVRRWLERPNVIVLEPGPRHLDVMESLLAPLGVGGNLTTDAHLATLAMEHQGELHSNDADFARFSGLRWRNPLE
jgi:toxin-antitoxin system PIN domain toxin